MTRNSSLRLNTPRNRAALLTSAATLTVALAGPAYAQQTVYLNEGTTVPNVALDGADRLVVDISRIDGDTALIDLGPLVSGSVTSAGGADTVWLRATESQTANVAQTRTGSAQQYAHVDGVEFTGGMVYEASGNDTILTLENRSRSTQTPQTNDSMIRYYEPLRLAGDGTIDLTFNVQADQADLPDRAIVVEQGSTSRDQGTGGDGRLDLIIRGTIDGNAGLNAQGEFDPDIGLIDVRNANSLRFAANSKATAGNHQLVLGGDAEIIIERNAILSLKSPSGEGSHPGRIILSSGVVRNAGRIDATSNGDSPNTETYTGDRGIGLYLEGADFYNTLTEGQTGTGEVWGGHYGVFVASGDNLIHNVGLIKSVNGAAIAVDGGSTLFRNSIYTFANGSQRAGVVTGGKLLSGQQVAYQDVGDSHDLIVNSGTMTGDVILGAGSDTFLYTGATNGVTGKINGGDDLTDAYGVSVSTSGAVTFANDLNSGDVSGFNLHGVELNGANLSVTLEAAGGVILTDGIKVLGAGTVTNNARIDDPAGLGIFLEQYDQITGGIDFVNAADINASAGVVAFSPLKSFRNTATITGNLMAVGISTQLTAGRDATLDFQNDGTLINVGGGEAYGALTVNLQAATGAASDLVLGDFRNSGTIRNTGSSTDASQTSAGSAVFLTINGNGVVNFANAGTVETTGSGTVGLRADGGRYDIVNTNLIQSLGAGSGGVLMRGTAGSTAQVDHFTNSASGVVRANGGGFAGADGLAFAFGLGAVGIANGRTVQVDNAGTIEATGANSIAVAAVGVGDVTSANFTLNNTGTIRGGADTILIRDAEVADNLLRLQTVLGDEDEVRTVGGAIQTYRTTDLIRNSGTIIGSVHLDLGDDRFENYGTLDGNVRMGEGDDTFVLGGGTLAAGRTVNGDAGNNVLLVDMSNDIDKIIDGARYFNFETIERMTGTTGAGKLFLRGEFNVGSLILKEVTVHIAENDFVDTAAPWAFLGSELGETINNFGSINGHVDLGLGDDVIDNAGIIFGHAEMGGGDNVLTNSGQITMGASFDNGDDVLTNSGDIDASVSMGAGNDVVTNSGTITGALDLGDGDDRYEAIGAGTVTGGIDGGDGDDTFVFRLQGMTGSIPGGFDGFESFAAYGPGTLQLALERDYGTLEVLEGANLELTNAGAWDVDLIKGDDSAQSVKIDAGFTGGVSLAGGDDSLEMSLGGVLAGALDGGAGMDTLKLNLTAASTLNDLFGFETVNVTGSSPLTLEGTLGAGQKIGFDDANNEFIIAENAVFEGQADGGGGSDILRIATGAVGSRTIVAGQLTSFESLYSDGSGTLAFNGGTYSFTTFEASGGDIAFGGGAKLTAGSAAILFTGNADNRFTLEYGSSIGSRVDGGDGDGDVLAFAQAAGQTQKLSVLSAENFEILAASGAGEFHIDQDATFDTVLLEGGNIKLLADVILTADVVGGAGADTFDNAGTVDGDILLGAGDDTYVARTGSSVTDGHVIDGGVGGNDTVVYSLNDGAGSLLDNVINFESIGVYGPGTLNLALSEDFISIKLMDGANLNLTDDGGTIGSIIGDDSSQVVTIGDALTGGVSLGGGDDTLNLTLGGVLSGALDGGAGNDILNLALTTASTINGMNGFETANITGGHALTLAGALGAGQRINFDGSDDELIIAAGADFKGVVDGGAGQNLLRVQSGASDSRTVVTSQILNFQDLVSEGAGTLALTGGAYDFDSVAVAGGNLELGADTALTSETGVVFDAADNRLTLGSGATITGGVDAGEGEDTLALAQAAGLVRTYSALGAQGFERLETSGAGELRFDIDAAFVNGVSLNGGTTTVNANATLIADVTGGAAADILTILGQVDGDVNLGAGDDRLIVSGGNGAGLRSGGEGEDDILDFRTAGTYGAPAVYDASRYDGFEKLTVSGGVLSMISNSSWKGMSLTGGRLIGQAGTTLTSETAIDVGAGAVFGSAGIVNADINVKGTLSPGASPGTMTVNGDVSFASGSNLLLEVSPGASDLLNINGKMIIANGATVDITGILESTPGATLDLVVASDGIEGRFTTINKSSSIFGFVAQNGNKLQIRGEFQNDNAFGTNAQRSIAYANAVLGSGQAVQAFTQAVPVLVDANGVSNAATFEQLTPEAYGSAMLIGTETVLSVIDTARALDIGAPRAEGFYSFAQAIVLQTEMDARARTGASSAELDMGGVFGGVGYSTASGVSLGAFVGKTSAEQNLGQLDATTRSDGYLVGAFAGAAYAGVNLNGLVAYDRTQARTQRTLDVGIDSGRGRYDLSTWTADVNVAYPMSLGGVSVTPNAGVTYVSARRDTVSEITGGAFALNVDGDTRDGWFADAGVKVATTTVFQGRALEPYLQAGVRKVLSDDGQRVSGSLIGVTGAELEVHGARRDRTVARLATGFSYEMDPSIHLHAGYAGEFGDNTRHNLAVGVSMKF